MSKFKEIERRFNIGYAPSVYGTVANARLQTQNDLGELISEFKKLTIPNVSQQRELLFYYEKMRTSHVIGATDEWRYSNVDLFMSKL